MSIISDIREFIGVFSSCKPQPEPVRCKDCGYAVAASESVLSFIEGRSVRLCGPCWAIRIENREDQ